MYFKLFFPSFLVTFSINAAFINHTYQDVLKKEYEGCTIKKENLFLTKDQVKRIKKKYAYNTSALVLRYINSCRHSYIYIDSSIVRTMNQTVIIEVKDSKILNLKIASFMEPKQYLPKQAWLNIFKKNKNTVDALTGATISENAIKRIVKKYVLIDNIQNDKK